jgi:hypothetical protein
VQEYSLISAKILNNSAKNTAISLIFFELFPFGSKILQFLQEMLLQAPLGMENDALFTGNLQVPL